MVAFEMNFNFVPYNLFVMNNGTLSFFPFLINDSISLKTINLFFREGRTSWTQTISMGLYSLTGNTLSLANSASLSYQKANIAAVQTVYRSITDISATQNITPGTWYWGIMNSTSNNSQLSMIGQSTINPGNAFPGAFVGGRMTVSTNALPGSYATSDLDITGSDSTSIPLIILSA